jgi:hypothetical protein
LSIGQLRALSPEKQRFPKAQRQKFSTFSTDSETSMKNQPVLSKPHWPSKFFPRFALILTTAAFFSIVLAINSKLATNETENINQNQTTATENTALSKEASKQASKQVVFHY